MYIGQQEVYEYLRKNNSKYYTAKEISKALKITIGAITASLRKLREYNQIDHKKSGKRNEFLYKFKRGK